MIRTDRNTITDRFYGSFAATTGAVATNVWWQMTTVVAMNRFLVSIQKLLFDNELIGKEAVDL